MLRKQSRSYNSLSPSFRKGRRRRPKSDYGAGQLWKFRFLIVILAFLILSSFSKVSFAQKDLGVPVREAICFIDPRNDQVALVAKPTVAIHSGMAMLGRKIYFGSGANLWEFEIPLEPSKPVE
jgi:hypothetical protein